MLMVAIILIKLVSQIRSNRVTYLYGFVTKGFYSRILAEVLYNGVLHVYYLRHCKLIIKIPIYLHRYFIFSLLMLPGVR